MYVYVCMYIYIYIYTSSPVCVSAQVLTMVPLDAPLQKVVPAAGCSLVQYHLPVKVERGASRYEMDVEVGLEN